MSKSPNKHNRLYCQAEPLPEGLADDIEAGKINPKDDPKERGKTLIETYGMEKNDVTKIWSFGPENQGPNLLIDYTKGVQFMNEIKDSMENAFQWATKEAVMTDENMRNIRINICDVVLHADAIHRGGGQLIPTARRVYYACELTANPALQEPVFLAEITCPADSMGGVYQILNQRRGIVIEEE